MQQLSSFMPSVLVLGTILIVSVILAVTRPRLRPEVRTSVRFLSVVALTILAQGFHFLEEWRSRFYVRLPEAFGLPPFGEALFVWFNAAWLAIWVISLFAVRRGIVIAACPLWFLGLGMVLNLLAHPILALRASAYFPGLFTSPIVGLLGILTIRELLRVSAPEGVARPSDARWER